MSSILVPKRIEIRRKAQRLEAPGRPTRSVAGSWVTDLAEIKQTILLCWRCEHKFRKIAHRYHYHFADNWKNVYGGVSGKCDDCGEMGAGRACFVHQSYFGKSYDPD